MKHIPSLPSFETMKEEDVVPSIDRIYEQWHPLEMIPFLLILVDKGWSSLEWLRSEPYEKYVEVNFHSNSQVRSKPHPHSWTRISHHKKSQP